MKNKLYFIVFWIVIFVAVKLLFFYPANYGIQTKLNMIEDEIAKQGYKTSWIVISGKRSRWYNKLLSNSADNSHHLHGNAIDIFVFDIDGDNKFDEKDVKILRTANQYVEKNFPKYKGSFGTYRSKGYLTRHMVHFDTRGYSLYYNK